MKQTFYSYTFVNIFQNYDAQLNNSYLSVATNCLSDIATGALYCLFRSISTVPVFLLPKFIYKCSILPLFLISHFEAFLCMISYYSLPISSSISKMFMLLKLTFIYKKKQDLVFSVKLHLGLIPWTLTLDPYPLSHIP